MMEIHLDSLSRASYDEFSEKLTLDLGNGVSIRITDYALSVLRETLPSSTSDLSDLESAIGELRSRLEDAQHDITNALENAQSNLSDAESNLSDAQSAADCHGDAAQALDNLESAFNDLNG